MSAAPDVAAQAVDRTGLLSLLPPRVQPAPGISRRQARRIRRADKMERRAAGTWTRTERRVAKGLAVLTVAIAGVTFYSLFGTVYKVMKPSMGGDAWMVPVAGEIAFTYLFGNGLLHALRRAPSGLIRPAVMTLLMAGSVALQGYAARGSWPSLVGHELIVTAFYGVLLSAKSTVMILLGGKVRADRITIAEWIAHPVQAGRLWRWRATWGEPSADRARERYMRLLFAEAIAQADPRIGREEGWREKLPAILRYQLATGLFPGSAVTPDGDWQETVQRHVESQLSLLPDATPEGSAEGSGGHPAEETAAEEMPVLSRKPEGRRGGTARGSARGTAGGNAEGKDWPETKDIPKAELTRRIKTAIARHERANAGRRLPAYQLSAAIRVRMSKDTAGPLLREVYAQLAASELQR